MASVRAPINNDRYIRVIFRLLMPRLKGRLKKIAMATTVEMVSPILARAEPSAGFKLFCSRLVLAALTAL